MPTKKNVELQKEVNSLSRQLDRAKHKIAGEWPDEELRPIAEALKDELINVSSFAQDTSEVSILILLSLFSNQMIIGIDNKQGMSDFEKSLFFDAFPKLQSHGLASLEKVAGAAWRRYRLNEKGNAFVAFLKRSKIIQKPKVASTSEGDSPSKNSIKSIKSQRRPKSKQ